MKNVINTVDAPKAIGPYSQAIESGNMLFISGQIPVNPVDGTIPEGIEAQTEQVMSNICSILKKAGYQINDVVKCTCLLKNMDDFKIFNSVYGKYFAIDPPARAAFGVVQLPMNVLIEIEAIAIKEH